MIYLFQTQSGEMDKGSDCLLYFFETETLEIEKAT